jgi:hypothetical protein
VTKSIRHRSQWTTRLFNLTSDTPRTVLVYVCKMYKIIVQKRFGGTMPTLLDIKLFYCKSYKEYSSFHPNAMQYLFHNAITRWRSDRKKLFFHFILRSCGAETSKNKSYHLGEVLCCLACMVFITIIRKIQSLQDVYFRVPPSVPEPYPIAYVFGPPGSASVSVRDQYGSRSFPILIQVLSGLK